MLLSERKQKAQQLSRELGKMNGVWVVSPLPLDDSCKLRFQVLDTRKNEVLELLRSWEWKPEFCSILPRITHKGMEGACIYEIDLPRERQPVMDRTIRGEIGGKEKSTEADLVMRHLGWKQ